MYTNMNDESAFNYKLHIYIYLLKLLTCMFLCINSGIPTRKKYINILVYRFKFAIFISHKQLKLISST